MNIYDMFSKQQQHDYLYKNLYFPSSKLYTKSSEFCIRPQIPFSMALDAMNWAHTTQPIYQIKVQKSKKS